MRKNLRKWIAMLCVFALMAGILSGCESKETESSVSETKEAEKEVESTSENTQETEEAFSYPMDGRKLTLSIDVLGAQEAAGYDSYGDTEYAKAVAEAVGVEIEYVQGKDDWFSLLLADGDYPDIMEAWWLNVYPGGLEGAGRDEVVMPLNDVIDAYMPNFKAWLENNPKDAEMLYTAEGIIYGVPFVYENNDMLNTKGLMIRKDWLDELNLEVPETIDDWHEVLTAFKEEKGVIPFSNISKYILAQGGFRYAYVPYGNYSLDPETGNVVFTQATDAYREYLTVMNQWYNEGLLDSDFASLDLSTITAKMLNGELGATWAWNGDIEKPEIELVAVANPAKDADTELVHIGPVERLGNYWAAISTQCEDVEAAARYLDFFFTEEGMLLSNYGIEGVTYTLEEGVPKYTDEILNNPDGLDQSAAKGKYIRAYNAFPGIRMFEYEVGNYALEATRDSYSIWGKGTKEYKLPASVKLLEEESETVADIEAEVLTYVSEMCVKFILGTEDIETKWDSYIETLKQFSIDEAVNCYQAAYDRYMEK